MKTLLVDDHGLFREGLAMLITQGFAQLHLLQAGDIAEAMNQLQAHPDTELLLLDLALPDSAGTSGLMRLREHAPQVTIVVLSADDQSTEALRPLAEGDGRRVITVGESARADVRLPSQATMMRFIENGFCCLRGTTSTGRPESNSTASVTTSSGPSLSGSAWLTMVRS